MVIYIVTNKINKKSYIGKTVYSLAHRRSQHTSNIKDNTTIYFQRAILKYGKNNFKWNILWEGICSKEWLSELEKYYIYFYDTFNSGYNMTRGGDGAEFGKDNSFCKLSPKKRMETILKGNVKRRQHRHTAETKTKMSKTRMKMYKGRNNPLSKIYKLTSPSGKIFIVKDGLENFCNTLNLSFGMIRKIMNKNCSVTRTIKSRRSHKTENTIGWRAYECL